MDYNSIEWKIIYFTLGLTTGIAVVFLWALYKFG